jgi:G:T-mismatch repair DNA endonuclease (very short patch repair protein)
MLEMTKMIYSKYNVIIHVGTLKAKLNAFGIKTPTCKSIANSMAIRNKYKETCKKKYGCENASQNADIQRKKEDTFLKHYGIKNIFCGYKKLHDIMVQNGTNMSSWERIKLKNGTHTCCSAYSKLNTKVEDILKYLNVEYKSEPILKVQSYNKQRQKNYYPRPDFLVQNTKIIEVYGDYWHMNPLKYKDTDINKNRKMTSKEIWEHDNLRLDSFRKCGYDTLIIWENDINNDMENVICRIKEYLKL